MFKKIIYFIWLCHVLAVACMTCTCDMWHLVPQPETEPRPSTLGTWSLSHWTTREIPKGNILPPLVPRMSSSWNVIPDSNNVVSWRAILVCLFVCLAQKKMRCVRHAWFVPKNLAGFNNLYGDRHRGKWLLSFSVSFVVQVRSSIMESEMFQGLHWWLIDKESACNARGPGLTLGWEDPWEKGMATHSSIFAWRFPWTEKPGGLQSMGSHAAGCGQKKKKRRRIK